MSKNQNSQSKGLILTFVLAFTATIVWHCPDSMSNLTHITPQIPT